jgi:transposase
LFSKHNLEELKVIVLDNGAFHKAKSLIVHNNIILIFLPPHSSELNPAEKIWQQYKRMFTNQFFKTLDQLEVFVSNLTKSLPKKNIISICAYSYIFLNQFWSAL